MVIICSHCQGTKFTFFPTKQDYKIIQCSKLGCKAVRDVTCIAEDVKHAIYHERAEPTHQNLYEEQ